MPECLKVFFVLCALFLFSGVHADVFKNKLVNEDSPYLQQHANNPVNWYPWDEKTLQKARDEKKLIFLSIGYSTCHWCHVMAHESFESDEIAKLINRDYVAIKVDREELPHLDKYYQNLHILLKNRSGGWPLNAILTEEARPFFIATYIPPNAQGNWEGLDTLLPRIASEYRKEKTEIFSQSIAIEKQMQGTANERVVPVKIELSVTKKIFAGLTKQFDEVYYGFSIQPKFPESAKVQLLFDLDALGVDGARGMALDVLRAMALGGLYDQVEGGFFRYSTDAAWEVPHFEKMLYTSAELLPLYVKAYELSQDELYKQVVVETIEMIEDRFKKDDVYFSASDADSNDKEGSYFIYTHDEMTKVMHGLLPEEKDELIEAMDISGFGNFEEMTHINFYTKSRPLSFEKVRGRLQSIRQGREYPFIDKKVNTAWNAMMIEALFHASRLDENYTSVAEERVRSLLEKMYIKGVLYHQSLADKVPRQKALLEDYAFLISALIEGYETNYNEQYLYLAKQLSDEAIKKFYDGQHWYLNEEGFKVYADMSDKYYTAPMSKMLIGLLKLASLNSETKYLEPVQDALKNNSAKLSKNPSSYPAAMQVLLRQKRGYVTLKAQRIKLLGEHRRIHKINYPFILTKSDPKLKEYLACDIGQCFGMDKELKIVIKMIESH